MAQIGVEISGARSRRIQLGISSGPVALWILVGIRLFFTSSIFMMYWSGTKVSVCDSIVLSLFSACRNLI